MNRDILLHEIQKRVDCVDSENKEMQAKLIEDIALDFAIFWLKKARSDSVRFFKTDKYVMQIDDAITDLRSLPYPGTGIAYGVGPEGEYISTDNNKTWGKTKST